jgi:hypothetical protein
MGFERLPNFVLPGVRQRMSMFVTYRLEGSINRLAFHDAAAFHRPNEILSYGGYIAQLALLPFVLIV